jgi:hypothetical protein
MNGGMPIAANGVKFPEGIDFLFQAYHKMNYLYIEV